LNERWISASQARELVSQGWQDEGKATDAICRRAQHGDIQAKARRLITYENGQKFEKHDEPIGRDFWGDRDMKQDWSHGDFVSAIYPDDTKFEVEAIGVTFDQAGIEAMVPRKSGTGASSQPGAAGDRHKGGRPTKVNWEAVMVDLARQLYVGDLKPTAQADVERAIADYLSGDDITLSESTIRDHARELWQAVQKEDEN
jgi:hypothetical protein